MVIQSHKFKIGDLVRFVKKYRDEMPHLTNLVGRVCKIDGDHIEATSVTAYQSPSWMDHVDRLERVEQPKVRGNELYFEEPEKT